MPKLLTFDIIFNNPDAIYMAGSTVSGYVLVELNDTMMMRGKQPEGRINLQFVCEVKQCRIKTPEKLFNGFLI